MKNRINTQTSAPSFPGRFFRNRDGATAIEYALIAGGISIVIVATINGLGSQVVALFTSVVNSF